jgi:hypothetical protein
LPNLCMLGAHDEKNGLVEYEYERNHRSGAVARQSSTLNSSLRKFIMLHIKLIRPLSTVICCPSSRHMPKASSP